jgi:hypothetical protein
MKCGFPAEHRDYRLDLWRVASRRQACAPNQAARHLVSAVVGRPGTGPNQPGEVNQEIGTTG